MLKLIKFEMIKLNLKKYIYSAIICIFILFVIVTTILNFEDQYSDFRSSFSLVTSFTSAVFIIFSSVLIAKIFIDEYQQKTIIQLYMYPINKKTIIYAKLIVLLCFVFLAVLISQMMVSFIYYWLYYLFQFKPGNLEDYKVINLIFQILINATTTAFISLIPLYIGMIKKSIPATIISSITMITIVFSNSNGQSLSNTIFVPLIFAAIGLFLTYILIIRLLKEDL